MALSTLVTGTSDSPFKVPQSWDSISIGGVIYGPYGPPSGQFAQKIVGTQAVTDPTQPLPIGGKVRIRRASRKYKIDIKDPPGADGAQISYRGIRPKQFDILFFIWTDAQYKYFTQKVLPAILYSGVKHQVQPIAVYHPSLSQLSIANIFVEDIGAIEQVSDDLMFQCVVQVAEFIPAPPVNTTATPLASKTTNPPTTPGIQPPSAVTSRLAIISNLNAQAAAAGLFAPFGKP